MAAQKIDLTSLSEEELIELNRKIVDRLRFIRDARAHHQMLELKPGDPVFFTSEGGQKISGSIVQLNRKTVSLCTHDGHRWRVSPSLLTRAEPKEVQAEVEPKPSDSSQASPSGVMPPSPTFLFQSGSHQEVPRNAPCPCGSGKKHKRCCLDKNRISGTRI